MTTVTVLSSSGQITGLHLQGHAGYSEEGSDIVCAAISSLVTSGANAMETVAHLHPVVRQNAKKAQFMLALPKELTQQQLHDGRIVLSTVLQGLRDIAAEYPEYIKIT